MDQTDGTDGSVDIGVSLSGGGHRATLFGLGVLLYLAHAHDERDQPLSRRVSAISSVSGGSITNGFLAQSLDYRCAEAVQVEVAAQTLATQLAEPAFCSPVAACTSCRDTRSSTCHRVASPASGRVGSRTRRGVTRPRAYAYGADSLTWPGSRLRVSGPIVLPLTFTNVSEILSSKCDPISLTRALDFEIR